MRLRSGDKHHLRKSADRKAQISPVSGMNAFLICAFRSADFLRWCLSPERNLTHNLFLLFPIVFGINLTNIFRCDGKKGGATGNSPVSVIRSPVAPFDRGKRRVRILRRVHATFLATESVNSAPFERGGTKVHCLGKKVENYRH